MRKKILLPDGTVIGNMGIGTWYMGDLLSTRNEENRCCYCWYVSDS